MTGKLSLCLLGVFGTGSVRADWALNMTKGVTELSAETYALHMQVFYWCCAIAVVVFGAMIFSLVRHRKSLGVEPAKFTHSMTAEIVWTVIPIIILLLMAVPAAETVVRLEDSRKPDLTVVITGYQWRWHYAYQGQDVSFYSSLARDSMKARHRNSGVDPFTVEHYLLDVDKRLIVPQDAKVRLLLTSNDVVHSWWVPQLAIKKDAIPGFMNEAWFRAEQTGVFRGQCAELCGMDHGYMPIVVEVVPQQTFQAWLQREQGGAAKLASAIDSGDL